MSGTVRVAATGNGFDRLARVYRALEYAAFGRALERARYAHLHTLASARHILVIGDGDGRTVARLAALASQAQIRCVDTSAAMLALLRARLRPADQTRVICEQRDVRTLVLEPGSCDAVVTLFVLDCFTDNDAAEVIARLAPALAPGGRWLFADFEIPARGWRRRRAQVWVWLLYVFFRRMTGIEARRLPPSEALIRRAGLRVAAETTFSLGLLRSVVFEADTRTQQRREHVAPGVAS